jgi:hypoxanthine phosphoribosyltransferase
MQKNRYFCENLSKLSKSSIRTMKKVTYNGLTFKPYITRDRIQTRIKELGTQITSDFKDRRPLFLVVLNGAFPFASDLFREIDTDAEISFIRLKSYEGTSTTGVVKQVLGLTENIEGRPVVVVEDIVDTGTTIMNLLSDLRKQNPSEIKVATLLFKPDSLQHGSAPDYVGFSIPAKFIIGFGLDLDGLARNLPDIWVLDDEATNAQ